jgi:hypothetical protein
MIIKNIINQSLNKKEVVMKIKLRNLMIIVSIAFAAIVISQDIFAQTQRNPVLEYCTGTWCVYCPQGHAVIRDQILPNIPNAIIIGYHGPANGTDPFSFFPGNNILSLFGFSSYPTGVVDRVSGIISRGSWFSQMNARNSVPATVAIDVDRSFNKITREFSATIDFTALTSLSGQYNYNVILLESGMVWAQTGGTSNYVHHHVARAMMNGAPGQEVINGTWNQGDVITKSMNYTVPVPGGPGPDIIWDSCNVVVLVYKVGSPLSSAAPIQQAVQMTLVSPDYVAAIASHSPDVIVSNISTAEFSATLFNQGLMNDTYNITATLDGPAGWLGVFTTENGTFPFGDLDSVQVTVGDSTSISVEVNPNYLNGSGVITLECASKNDPGMIVNVTFNVVTNTGVHLLVVDASGEGYGSIISNTLDGFYEGRYGVVSREAFNVASLDLSYFTMIAWAGGNSSPAFYPEEVDNLKDYLDQGGNLLLTAHNLGSDIFEAGGQSQFAQSFFNNYLHSSYVADFGGSYILTGYTGDPITDGTVMPLNSVYTRSPDQISAFDVSATPIAQFGSGPNINSVRADNGNHKIVYFGFAFEQLNDVTVADTLVRRSVQWLTDGIVLDNPRDESMITSFNLEQNYPNPFNPATTIAYSIPKEAQVSLKIYDVMGREVVELASGRQTAGSYSVEFDASSLASGTYFYKLTAGEFVSVKKMVLLK